MVVEAFLDPRATPHLVAVVLMLALAAALLAINFGSRVNRAFALFLVFRGFAMGLAALGGVDADAVRADYWARVGGYFYLAAIPALVYFLGLYPRRRRWLAQGPWGGALLLAGGIGLVAAYAADKCLWVCPDPASGLTRLGPLTALSLILLLASAGAYFVIEHTRTPAGTRRDALLLVGTALVLNGLFDGLRALGDLHAVLGRSLPDLGLAPTPWAWLTFLWGPLALVPSAAALGVLVARWRTEPPSPRARALVLGGALAAVATGALVAFNSRGVLAGTWGIFVLGLWRLSIPLVVTYGIVRYQLFDIDLRLKVTLKRSAIAAVFAAAFLVGGELLEEVVPVDGNVLGLAVAATIPLTLRPLERQAQRLVDRLMPGVERSDAYVLDRKLEVYRAAVESALEVNGIDADERALLDRLGTKLGLSRDEAARVEASLAAAMEVPTRAAVPA